MSDEDVTAISEKLDSGMLLFKAPEENPYNMFA